MTGTPRGTGTGSGSPAAAARCTMPRIRSGSRPAVIPPWIAGLAKVPIADLAQALRERAQNMTDDERVDELCLFLAQEPGTQATRRRIRRKKVAGANTLPKTEELMDLL